MADEETGLVYSSDKGRMCPDCAQPVGACTCRREQKQPAAGPVRLRLERKGRGGKAVTVVSDLPLVGAELKQLAKTLKQRCGSGGTLKQGNIEIQGDHRDSVAQYISERGWRLKRCGG